MPMWDWGWGPPWGGFGWVFPLIGMVIMAIMVFACFRMMGGVAGFGCMGGHRDHSADTIDGLRREILGLREEVRKLRDRT